MGFLLRTMADEFSAEHLYEIIRVVAVVFEAFDHMVVSTERVERIARAVRADETLATGNCGQQRRFACGGHGRQAVAAGIALGFREIAGRVEEKGVELCEILRRDEAAVLGIDEIDPLFLADASEDAERIAVTRLAA